jgi:hypothetical protein
MLKSGELFEQVFALQFEEYGDFDISEVEDLDGVTDFNQTLIQKDGWYFESTYEFIYNGKKYSFEKREHSSDNVCDTEYLMHTFQEVELELSFQEQVKNAVKFMFENGDISIYTDMGEGYDGKYIETTVYINGDKVFENTESISLRF